MRAAMNSVGLCLDYALEVPTLQSIIRASKNTQWNLEDIDWDQELGDDDYTRILEWQGVMRSEYIAGLPKRKLRALARQLVAFEFSQILHGEQGAMMLAGQLTNCVEDLDARLFAATQVKDEARHVEAVRKLVQRIGPIYPCGEVLEGNLETLLVSKIWPKQVLGLQLFLEARALLTFRQHLLFVDDEVFCSALRRIEKDESQHVAFGVRYLSRGIEELSEDERRELVEYAAFLDQNVWRMTQPEEYAAPFSECGLDFNAFRATYRPPGRFKLRVKSANRRSIETMNEQFRAWFHRALQRTGIAREAELREFEMASGDDAGDMLPWIEAELD